MIEYVLFHENELCIRNYSLNIYAHTYELYLKFSKTNLVHVHSC